MGGFVQREGAVGRAGRALAGHHRVSGFCRRQPTTGTPQPEEGDEEMEERGEATKEGAGRSLVAPRDGWQSVTPPNVVGSDISPSQAVLSEVEWEQTSHPAFYKKPRSHFSLGWR